MGKSFQFFKTDKDHETQRGRSTFPRHTATDAYLNSGLPGTKVCIHSTSPLWWMIPKKQNLRQGLVHIIYEHSPEKGGEDRTTGRNVVSAGESFLTLVQQGTLKHV